MTIDIIANRSLLLPNGDTKMQDIIDKTPHQSALRKGRVSITGCWYSVTACIEGKKRLLVPDPLRPLAEVRPARIIEDSIRWLHKQNRWICKGYVVMPDHVHIVFVLKEGQTLSGVMASFGKFTARKLNELKRTEGQVWQNGFYDHCLRNDESYIRHLHYVCDNPIRKGWVQKAEDWPFFAIEPNW